MPNVLATQLMTADTRCVERPAGRLVTAGTSWSLGRLVQTGQSTQTDLKDWTKYKSEIETMQGTQGYLYKANFWSTLRSSGLRKK